MQPLVRSSARASMESQEGAHEAQLGPPLEAKLLHASNRLRSARHHAMGEVMAGHIHLRVDTDVLRHAAKTIDDVADDLAAVLDDPLLPTRSAYGEASLVSAANRFADSWLSGGTKQFPASVRDTADGLRENAGNYDEIDHSLSDELKRLWTRPGEEFDPAAVTYLQG